MTRKLVWIAATIVVMVFVVFAALSIYSRRAPQLGLVDGRLKPCPERPNCVCSESETANTEPLRFSGPAPVAWEQFAGSVTASGGQVLQQTSDYLHATFESTYFRFVDDFEARLDLETGSIHVRSASRVGQNDRGVNRERVDKLRFASLPG